jgi:Mg-chelatase subunit ChlD
MSEVPIGEAELLILVMDGSGSMATTDTFDQRRRADHLYDLVKATMERLARSTRKPIYRISLIYFDNQVYPVEKEGCKYFTLDEALKYIKNPIEVTRGDGTGIAGALRKAMEIIDDFYKNEALPQNKRVTVFLFTDGAENVESEYAVREVANQIKAHPSSPILATASFGTSGEMNKGLLIQVASESSERQKRHLKLAKVAEQLEDLNKLFIDGNVGGEITKQKAEALRNFVYVLSVTKEE